MIISIASILAMARYSFGVAYAMSIGRQPGSDDRGAHGAGRRILILRRAKQTLSLVCLVAIVLLGACAGNTWDGIASMLIVLGGVLASEIVLRYETRKRSR